MIARTTKEEILLGAFDHVGRTRPELLSEKDGILRRAAQLCEIPFSEAEVIFDVWARRVLDNVEVKRTLANTGS